MSKREVGNALVQRSRTQAQGTTGKPENQGRHGDSLRRVAKMTRQEWRDACIGIVVVAVVIAFWWAAAYVVVGR